MRLPTLQRSPKEHLRIRKVRAVYQWRASRFKKAFKISSPVPSGFTSNRAIEEAFQNDQGATHLRDLSGFKDNFLSALLDGLHKGLSSRHRGSSLFLEGIAQSLAVHLVRTYAEETTQDYKGGLPGFRLRKVTDLMVTHLEDEFSLIRLAREAEMSEFHFSRAFKRTAGLTPSQYFINLRLEKARRLESPESK